MWKTIKDKKLYIFVAVCLIASFILILINLTQIQRFQTNLKNKTRQGDIASILIGIKNYINENNSVPTTSNPDKNSFLPEIIFSGNQPYGGITVNSLEGISSYINTSIKDPQSNPYFIGTFKDQVIVYTPNFENYDGSKQTFSDSIKINASTEGKIQVK